jgi:geranylgeranyl pyrophosphate synthase
MYAQKTAAGVAGLAECAAIVARCDADKKALVYSFARDFGVAFQLIDDVHDYSVSSKWRKSAGEDFREGKLTYVLTEALKCLSSSKQSRLIEIFCSKELRTSKAGHEEGMELVRSSGAFDTTKQRARTLFDSAWQRLSSDTPSSESRFLLKVLSQKLISLDYEN